MPLSCWDAVSDMNDLMPSFSFSIPHFICGKWKMSSPLFNRLCNNGVYWVFLLPFPLVFSTDTALVWPGGNWRQLLCQFFAVAMLYSHSDLKSPLLCLRLLSGHLAMLEEQWHCLLNWLPLQCFRCHEMQGLFCKRLGKTIIFTMFNGTENTDWWFNLFYSIEQRRHSLISDCPVLLLLWIIPQPLGWAHIAFQKSELAVNRAFWDTDGVNKTTPPICICFLIFVLSYVISIYRFDSQYVAEKLFIVNFRPFLNILGPWITQQGFGICLDAIYCKPSGVFLLDAGVNFFLRKPLWGVQLISSKCSGHEFSFRSSLFETSLGKEILQRSDRPAQEIVVFKRFFSLPWHCKGEIYG